MDFDGIHPDLFWLYADGSKLNLDDTHCDLCSCASGLRCMQSVSVDSEKEPINMEICGKVEIEVTACDVQRQKKNHLR